MQPIARVGTGAHAPRLGVEPARQVVVGNLQRAQPAGERRQVGALRPNAAQTRRCNGSARILASIARATCSRRRSIEAPPDRHAGGRAHERAPAHPEQVADPGAGQGEQLRAGREGAARRAQAREVAQRAQAAECALRPVERPRPRRRRCPGCVRPWRFSALPSTKPPAKNSLIIGEFGVWPGSGQRNVAREVRRVLIVERVRLDVEVERSRLAAVEHDRRQHRAQAPEQAARRRRRQRRGRCRDGRRRHRRRAVRSERGRRGDEQGRGEHADRPTRQGAARHGGSVPAATRF